MNDTLTRAVTIDRTRHPLSAMLRQYMIVETLQKINEFHQAGATSDQPFFGGKKAKGLCLKGSNTLPANLRLAGDIDMTINMGFKYDPEESEKALRAMIQHLGEKTGMDMHISDMSTHSPSDRAEWLHKEKKFLEVHCIRHIHTDDIPAIRTKLKSLFDFTDNDLKVLDDFGPQTISAIVEARKEIAKKSGTVYTPTAEEEAGTGLSEALRMDIILKDRLNIFAPYGMGTFEQILDGRDVQKPFGTLTFSNPIEEASDKLLALLTNKERARGDESHAKDLIDLYIRTREGKPSYRAWQPYVASRKWLVDLVRIAWPMRPTFHTEPELYFKKSDPEIGDNLRQIKSGLLKLQEHGIIGEALFGEKITRENNGHYAQLLLDHTWGLCQECFGVQRVGSKSQPSYSIRPPEKVQNYWDSCRRIPGIVEHPMDSRRGTSNRADLIQKTLKSKIDAMLEGPYERGNRTIIADSGATNALLRADPSRQWLGYAGVRR